MQAPPVTKSDMETLVAALIVLLNSGLLVVVVKILLAIGEFKGQLEAKFEKVDKLDKEMSSQGSLVQQLTGLVNKIVGYLQGRNKKDDLGNGGI
jgi:hypothetical protein